MNLQQLIEDIYDSSDPERQRQAAYEMKYVKTPEAVHILLSAAYEAKDAMLQQEAVRSLSVLAPDKAFQAFMKSTHHPDPEKRRRAYYHLGTLGDSQGIQIVLKGLHDTDESVRRAAVVATGRLGEDHRAIDALRRLLNGYEPESVKSMVTISIEMIEKRMGERRVHKGPIRSFNAPMHFKKELGNSGRSFNSQPPPARYRKETFERPKPPKSYTPRAF